MSDGDEERSNPEGLQKVRFPGESAKYRAARNRLLKAEIDLLQRIEAVAAKRRTPPLAGPIPEDCQFEELAAGGVHRRVRLSELFADGKDTLIVYNYMFGPQMAAPCVMCTSILDGLDGTAPHAMQRVNMVVVAWRTASSLRCHA